MNNYNELRNKPTINGKELIGDVNVNVLHHYSTDEHIVGTWIDGKTIYEKTYVFKQSISIHSSTYADISQEVPNYVDMDTIVTAFVTSNSKATDSVWCGMENNTFCLYCAEGIDANTLTITYTKVTD